ncbi:hypothetical protein X975_07527, partial [Stegodyphus mimosarum]
MAGAKEPLLLGGREISKNFTRRDRAHCSVRDSAEL